MAPALASKTVGMTLNSKIAKFFFGLLLVIQPALAVSAEESECQPPKGQLSGSSRETNRKYFEQQVSVAERLRQTAASKDAEWLETENLLIRSREEAGDGNWNAAFQLLQKACVQAELALQQAEYESQAWKSRVVN